LINVKDYAKFLLFFFIFLSSEGFFAHGKQGLEKTLSFDNFCSSNTIAVQAMIIFTQITT